MRRAICAAYLVACLQASGVAQAPTGSGQVQTLQFAMPSFSVLENAGTAQITVTRLGGTAGTIAAQVGTCPASPYTCPRTGTARPFDDYVPVNRPVTFLAGDATPKTAAIDIKDDDVAEGPETVILELCCVSPAGSGQTGSTFVALLTIVDNDGAPKPKSGTQPPPAATPTGPTGSVLPMPPFGTPEVGLKVPGMTLIGGQRRVPVRQTVDVLFWLLNSANVANMNFDVLYNDEVVRSEGAPEIGNLLRPDPRSQRSGALFTTNPQVSGLIKVGFANTSGVSGPPGTVMKATFRAVGKPGDSTRLHLQVDTINRPDGSVPAIYRIPGEIVITDEYGNIPGAPGAGGTGAGGGGGGQGPGGGAGGGPGTGTGSGAGGGGGTGNSGQGDCDGDGRLTTLDARCALEISVDLPVKSASPREMLEKVLNLDGAPGITSRDATLILQRAVQK